ncbi:tRNA (adenosine(37)-N6)-threonylcarbamoyltransferase complex ATPase subunit type 1 TsaE [Defluviimonas sp. SAOS-178_SWC]|uniref:tRNA (adenosine(37)-N6)-threonylcarbamoyltransferase complex ATPase subunit type 1 TsaE n=1 Tax=Defluviimonas sp. SAOS-178_SWC TaxID=3121287 RepID=UPI003221C9A9
MNDATLLPLSVRLDLPTPEATAELARWLAPRLHAGDVILLDGPIGAGKSHFCRSLIQARLKALDRMEDVPSPTYTLVQIYELDGVDIWHADLYRLTAADEAAELGLEEAFDQAICLVEWPDRLGEMAPGSALRVDLDPGAGPTDRSARLSARDPRWRPVLDILQTVDWHRHE